MWSIYYKSWFIPLIIWLLSLYSSLLYSFRHFTITSDSLLEYNTYILFIRQGYWSPAIDNMLSSALWTTYVPSVIQRATNINEEYLYRLWLAIVVSFLPMVVYLLVSKYTSKAVSVGIAIIVFTSFYYQGYAEYARMLIAITMAVCLLTSILNRSRWKYLLIVLSASGLIIAHYSTAYIWDGMLIGACLIMLAACVVWRKDVTYLLPVVYSVLLLNILMWFYYGDGLVSAVGQYANSARFYIGKELTDIVTALGDNGMADQAKVVWTLPTDILAARVLLLSRIGIASAIWIMLFRDKRAWTIEGISYFGVICVAIIAVSFKTIEVTIGSLRPSFIIMPLEFLGLAYWWGNRGNDWRLYPLLAIGAVVYH